MLKLLILEKIKRGVALPLISFALGLTIPVAASSQEVGRPEVILESIIPLGATSAVAAPGEPLAAFLLNFTPHSLMTRSIEVLDGDGIATLATLYVLMTQPLADQLRHGTRVWGGRSTRIEARQLPVELWPNYRDLFLEALSLAAQAHQATSKAPLPWVAQRGANLFELRAQMMMNLRERFATETPTYEVLSETIGEWLSVHFAEYLYKVRINQDWLSERQPLHVLKMDQGRPNPLVRFFAGQRFVFSEQSWLTATTAPNISERLCVSEKSPLLSNAPTHSSAPPQKTMELRPVELLKFSCSSIHPNE